MVDGDICAQGEGIECSGTVTIEIVCSVEANVGSICRARHGTVEVVVTGKGAASFSVTENGTSIVDTRDGGAYGETVCDTAAATARDTAIGRTIGGIGYAEGGMANATLHRASVIAYDATVA